MDRKYPTYPVFISIHPTRLGTPIHTIGGLHDITLTAAGSVITVGHSKYATVVDKAGKKVQMDLSRYGITSARGVTVDKDGYMYIIGYYSIWTKAK